MRGFVLNGASLSAGGHPGQCSATVSGSVVGDSTVSVSGTSLAVRGFASMVFGSHAHDYNDDDGCISFFGHNFQPPQRGLTSSVTVGGEPIYLDGNNVASDPGSGGQVNVTNNGGNGTVVKK